MKQLESVRLIRAFATLTVIISHLEGSFSLGRMGVDLFFVMSGFLITMVMHHNADPKVFIISRMARTIPLYWMATILLFIVVMIKPSYFNNTHADLSHLLQSLFFIPFFKNPGSIHPLYTIGWSLVFEVFFYIMVFVTLLLTKKHYKHEERVALLVIIFISCFIISRYLLPRTIATAELLRSSVFVETLFGVFAYQFYTMFKPTKNLKIQSGLAFVAFICLATMSQIKLQSENDLLLIFGIPSLIAFTCIVYCEELVRLMNARLSAVIIGISDASYATYLSHFLLIMVMRKIADTYMPAFSPSTLIGGTIATVLSLSLGSIIYHKIDIPSFKAFKPFMFNLFNRSWISTKQKAPYKPYHA